MKDIQINISRKTQKAEILLFLACFVIAFGLNVISIIVYNTSWSELFTQLLWVICLAALFYGLTVFFRVIYWGIRLLFKKKKK